MSPDLGTSFGAGALNIIFGRDQAIARWTGDKLQIDDFGQYQAIGLAHAGKILAGVVFNNYRRQTKDIEITAASETPWCWTPAFLWAVFSIPFGQFGCERVTAVTSVKNRPAKAFLFQVGFREEGILRRGFVGGVDAVLYGLLRNECRWLERNRHADKAA